MRGGVGTAHISFKVENRSVQGAEYLETRGACSKIQKLFGSQDHTAKQYFMEMDWYG